MGCMRRRTFLAAGVAGTALIVTAGGWLALRGSFATDAAETRAILRAIVPAMLDGALPSAVVERRAAIDATVDGVEHAIAGLPPAHRTELGRLFALLSITPARRALAGVASDWTAAGRGEVDAFLSGWRDSGWALKRSAYDALHQLVLAAWYGNERSWTAIGYPGPPVLEAR